ncbi:MAG TPA: tetratricopeptide repeat protein [Cytophagaceae bacterium]|jgi:tetratricopeptide (TPR) repeat protein
MKIISFILLNLIFFTLSNAQEGSEIFKVLASKGNNRLVAAGSSEEKPLTIGKKLYKGDKLVLLEGSYLGLVHKSGKTIELKKSGTFEVAKLSNEVASQNASVSKKYVDFVMGEMTAKDEDISKNRHKYMDVTGSVERDIHGEKIHLIAPPKEVGALVLSSPIVIRWEPLKDVQKYSVFVTNMFGDTLHKAETSTSFVDLDLSTLNPHNENIPQIISVEVKDNRKIKSEGYVLKYIPAPKAIELKKDIDNLKSEFIENTPLNKIMLAKFYEQNKLYLSAMECYQQAIELAPDVDDFQAEYGHFLIRNRIKPEPVSK